MGRESIRPEQMERYRQVIAGLKIDDAQKDEVIYALRSILQTFVDRAFGTDPVQLSRAKSIPDSFLADSSRAMLGHQQKEPEIKQISARDHEGPR